MNNANKQAAARKKLTVFLLSFTLLGSMMAMSGPVPVKVFADEQVSDAEQLDPTEISNPTETDSNAELNASPSAGSSEADVQAFAAAAGSHDANFSPETLQFLKANTGLDGEQWDNIMKLVNKPEQDDLNWTKYYGYCEDIGDDRGYTIGIFGATTGGAERRRAGRSRTF